VPLVPRRVDLGRPPHDPAGQFGRRAADADTLRAGGYLRHARLVSGPNPTKWYRKVARLRQQAERKFRHDPEARQRWLRSAMREAGLTR
jgi:hypothetical protein